MPVGGSCRDSFHALLALEWRVPGGAGTLAHFFAVSAYGLQHPDSMRYTREAIEWLRSAVHDALDTGRSTESLRESARVVAGASHVTRRAGEPVPAWGITSWSVTVADVLGGGTDDYPQHAREWAAATVADLRAHEQETR